MKVYVFKEDRHGQPYFLAVSKKSPNGGKTPHARTWRSPWNAKGVDRMHHVKTAGRMRDMKHMAFEAYMDKIRSQIGTSEIGMFECLSDDIGHAMAAFLKERLVDASLGWFNNGE